VTGKPPGTSLGDRPAGPEETGPHAEGLARTDLHIAPGAVRYEVQDIQPGKVFRALAYLVGVTVLVVAILYPAFRYFQARQRRADPPPPPLGQHQPGRPPVGPRLQTTPMQDLAQIRAEDERLLNSYGWVDEAAGTVHVPIAEAMRMMVARGAGAVAPAGSPAPGASTSPTGAGPTAAPSAAPSPAAASPGTGGHR
jgi:hypothetical protein